MFGLTVLRKARCEVCQVVKKDCLPQFARADGRPVDICAPCVASLLDFLLTLRAERGPRDSPGAATAHES
jgi:hypothetical protein